MFTLEYFIKKLGNIPEDKWCIDEYEKNGKYCVLGHCGFRIDVENSEEGEALIDLFYENELPSPAIINNGSMGSRSLFSQTNPKARIMAALDYINNRNLLSVST